MYEDKKSLQDFFKRVNGGKKPKIYSIVFSSEGTQELSFRAHGKRFVYNFELDNNNEFTNFVLVNSDTIDHVSDKLLNSLF